MGLTFYVAIINSTIFRHLLQIGRKLSLYKCLLYQYCTSAYITNTVQVPNVPILYKCVL